MSRHDKTRELLIGHYEKYPRLQLQDIFKFLHQSALGCEHLVSSPDTVTQRIKEEYASIPTDCCSECEPLDGNYLRVPLSYINRGLAPETLGKLFYLSAKKEEDATVKLIQKAETASRLIDEGILPFTQEEFSEAFEKWQNNNFPPLHHSDIFRNTYKPSYRVISSEFVPFLPLFAETDKMLKKGTVRMAIEGGSAAGKSTLADIFKSVYDCTVFHTDDFFLTPQQRTPERLKEPGGNLDRERFLEEVLIPLSRGEAVCYRRFDCSDMCILPPEIITPKPLTITEGAYSMHPIFRKYYNLSVFLRISPEEQKARIEKRNSPQLAQRFFNEWIPMETEYFNTLNPKAACTMIL